MTFKQTMSLLFSTAEGTYYKWKSQKRPIILLLDYLLTQSEIEEFLLSPEHKITKFEMIKDFEMILLGAKIDYLKFVDENLTPSLKYDLFADLYYTFLVYLDDIQRSEDTEIATTWTAGDAIPGFFLKADIKINAEHEIHKLQYKFGKVNNFDQNMSNFIRLCIGRDMLPLVANNIGSSIEISKPYRKSAVYHALLFNIYKKHPELDYKDKMKFLLELIAPGFKEEDADIILEKNWKFIEVDFDKYINNMKNK
jgi:hypothetical protein